ncbi:MAG: HAMP domain-containing histidine kinase [Oscillibacter sp.]|nr:HAMP domain-containing histidine kinase [Oscillibacter sp.]
MNSMEQVRKRFVLFAALSIFALLAALLCVINGVNFTMAAADADEITLTLANRNGAFRGARTPPDTGQTSGGKDELPPPDRETAKASFVGPQLPDSAEKTAASDNAYPDKAEESAAPQNQPPDKPSNNAASFDRGGHERRKRAPRIGPMGPDSPETVSSTRYFTYAFDESGNSEKIAFELSAVDEEEAVSWADSLRRVQQTGWTRTTYRYRVYHSGGWDFVTVIDQGRELLPSFRILIISIIGGLLSVAVSYLFLLSVSERLFKPLEDADRKQKRFIADVERDFKVPLTVVDADAEALEMERGETEETRSIHRQARRMAALVKDLSALAIFDNAEFEASELDLSGFARAAADGWRVKFADKGIALTTKIADDVTVQGDGASIAALLEEILENALKFGKDYAELSLSADNGRVEIRIKNGADLPSKSVEQVFDRFTRLDNAKDAPGVGLGLSRVKEIARAHNGRVSAKAADGAFTLRVSL